MYSRVDFENIFNNKYPLKRCHQRVIGELFYMLKHIKIRKSVEVKITYRKSRRHVISFDNSDDSFQVTA